jgi:DNA-binding MarR family transcriptional regulator
MSDHIEQIISLIFTTRKMLHEQKELHKGKCCSLLHIIALNHIQHDKPLMKNIADFLGVSPPSATSLVNTLAKSELIYRETDNADRRIVRIMISKKGKKFLEAHKKKMAEKMRENLSRLSAKERQQLKEILEKINR